MKFRHILLTSSHSSLIRSICFWNGYIVTGGADNTFKIWTQEGELLFTISAHSYWVNTVSAWDDLLVSGSYDQNIKLWKLKNSNKPGVILEEEMECVLYFKGHSGYVLSSVIWDGYLYTGSADKSIKMWNKQGNLLYEHSAAHSDGIRFMMVFHNNLFTASNDRTIKQWSKSDNSLTCERVFTGHTGYLNWICSWGNSRIASACHDNTVKVWDLDGTCLFTFETSGIAWAVTEWMGKLVGGTGNEGRSPHLFIWNWDGSLFQKIPSAPTSSLFVVSNRLWQGCDGPIRIWLEPRDWKIERLLWIAWMKNQPTECCLALLPKELVHVLITFLYE